MTARLEDRYVRSATERHPQADKLQVLSVDAGDGPMQVVCGAPNARAGLVGVFGPPGAYVPGLGITLKVAAIRGVEGNGDDLTLELVPDSGHFICEEKPALIAERARELFGA